MEKADTEGAKRGLIILIFVAFISLGLPDGLLGVAWPDMRAGFGLSLDALGVLLVGSTTGYLVSSFFNGVLLRKMGVGRLLSGSCFLTGLALLGYTLTPFWWLLPFLAVLSGLGAGGIDAGLNTYVEEKYGEGLMQWMHACFGIGVTLGPAIMTKGLGLTGSWRTGYIVVCIIQFFLALLFFLSISLWSDGEERGLDNLEAENDFVKAEENASDFSLIMTLKYLPAWLSIALFFVYTGIEFSLGHWSYTLLTESRGVNPEIAGLLVSGYWGFFTIGRILAGFLAYRFRSESLLKGAVLLGLSGSLLLILNSGACLSFLALAIVGIAIATIFQALVSSTSGRVGKEHTINTIGMQMAAAGLGGAFLPGLAGILARNISLEIIPVFLVLLFLVFSGLYRFTAYLVREKEKADDSGKEISLDK
ncbi:MAG: MFS transporter [Halanaerobiaceae bacterium]|nr:MFS transporter [Halanaerobiaceae bacterium]